MGYIKNYNSLASNDNRKIVLELIESALLSISPKTVFERDVSLNDTVLKIQTSKYDLSRFKKIYLLGFGKGSAEMCKILEGILGDKLTEGFVIDVVNQEFAKLHHTLGTHPLPSQENFDFTRSVIDKFNNLDEDDLVLITTCGGGSVLFESPQTLDLDHIILMNRALLTSGATISEMNTVRKHVSRVKGGGLAKILFPATVINLLFSDVPGNDLSVIASGPLVKDQTTVENATEIYEKYNLKNAHAFSTSDFVETPKEDKYFKNVTNILFLSNHTALKAMEKRARELGFTCVLLTDCLQGDAKKMGEKLLNETQPGQILIAGGETTVKIQGHGRGGRNQTVVLGSLPYLKEGWVISSIGTDGWDFYGYAGAIGDTDTIKKMHDQKISDRIYLDDDNSYEFFQKTGDGIDTGKLESNVSDLFIVFKK